LINVRCSLTVLCVFYVRSIEQRYGSSEKKKETRLFNRSNVLTFCVDAFNIMACHRCYFFNCQNGRMMIYIHKCCYPLMVRPHSFSAKMNVIKINIYSQHELITMLSMQIRSTKKKNGLIRLEVQFARKEVKKRAIFYNVSFFRDKWENIEFQAYTVEKFCKKLLGKIHSKLKLDICIG
jgi:hypothetical protein